MRFIGGHVSIAGGVDRAIENTLKIGGNCMQIFAGSPRSWQRTPFPEDKVKTFLEGHKKNGFGPTFIHALYLVNLASRNPELLQKSIQSLVGDMKNGSQIRASGVVVHIGSHTGLGFEAVKDQLVTVINQILDETSNIDLILENDAGQNGKIGSPEELGCLIKEIGNRGLKICLDTAHLFEADTDYRDLKTLEEFISELKKLNLIDKIVCIHLNDSSTDLGSHRDMHANLGDGKVGLEGLNNFVNHPSFNNLPLILETPGENHSGPDIRNISIAKNLVN